MSSSNALLIVLVATLVVSMVVAWAIVRRSRRRADAALADLGPTTRTVAASALGRSGVGRKLTGTGTLALTDTVLAFAQWRPATTVRIPRGDIVAVERTREHLGRTMHRDVLRVTWREGEAEESVAFYIHDLDPWLADLGGHQP